MPRYVRLFTWKLTPELGRHSEKWINSSYRGVVFVRAHDPVEARELAANRFASREHPHSSPWFVRSLVRCERLQERIYERVDIASVVYP